MNFKSFLAVALLGISTAVSACTPVWITSKWKVPGTTGGVPPSKTYCYGDQVWQEPSVHNNTLEQILYYWPGSTNNAPLVIYFHPNGQTARVQSNSLVMNQVVQPALAAGYAVASVEFRHPVTDQLIPNSSTDPRVPSWDVGYAIQYLRANAISLGIDPTNVFVVGHSRGTLSLWQSMQPDEVNPSAPDPFRRASTKVTAAWMYQAQTSYQDREYCPWFIIPGDVPTCESNFETDNPMWQQFGSTVESVTKDSPPVHLSYRDRFNPNLISYDEMETQWAPEHYPDYGIMLCNQYLAVGAVNPCVAYDNTPINQAYTGMMDFFNQYRH